MQILIVYYSRTGVTRKAAGAIRDVVMDSGQEVEVQVEELVDKRSRGGLTGYLTAGRDALLKRQADIEPVEIDPGAFDLVIIGTPVWAFTCTPAVRAFCEQYADDLPRVAFLATMGGSGDQRTFRDMEQLVGKAPVARLSLREKDVKAGATEGFLDKVNEFAGSLLADE